MYLSHLQRFILRRCLDLRQQRVRRSEFSAFYAEERHVSHKDQEDEITKSIERLIEKGLLVGYGRRTPKKWFIESLRFTPLGRRAAVGLLGKQQQIPFKEQGTVNG